MVGLRDVFVVAPTTTSSSSFHHQDSLFPSSSDHPLVPLLSATAPACLIADPHDSRSKSSGINLWQQQQLPLNSSLNPNPNPNSYLKKLETSGIVTASGSGCTATCQDCGNQAKKDCRHRRCRTCCKSGGFDCSTHVKSTWVPAVRRRERLLSASTSAPKRPRPSQTTTSPTSTSNTSRSFDTTSTHQDVNIKKRLPEQVKATAVFKCVRMSSVSSAEGGNEYAYQARVSIGGHVYKGFLYDHGEDECEGRDDEHLCSAVNAAAHNHSSSSSNLVPNISKLHLGGGGGGGGGARNESQSRTVLPGGMGMYGGGFIGVTSYGNSTQIN